MAHPHPHPRPFGDLLRQHRILAGLTQEALAERAGLSRRAISDLERGVNQTPQPATLDLLAQALDLSAAERVEFRAAAHRERLGRHPTPLPLAARPLLPTPPTPLFGRAREVQAVCALLARQDVRLLTLTGTAGVGKTRLALAVAAEVGAVFPDGVRFIPLAALADPALVLPTIAEALLLREANTLPLLTVLSNALREQQALLVLDNFEQVIGASPTLAALLETCPSVKLLVTSREVLHLRAEHQVVVSPLPVPALPPGAAREPLDPAALTENPAMQLFLHRVQAARPDFQVTQSTTLTLARICQYLEGIPLALELAAPRLKLLSPQALLARLEGRLQVLTGGAHDLPERQRTMRATIAWSYELLVPAEQTLFRRLAVFVGGWYFSAAEVICAAPEGAAPLALDLLEGLSTLIDHSLVQPREEGGEPRFGMLQVIREYALERLEECLEAEVLRRAHAAHFLALAEQAEPELSGPEAGAWLERLEREHDNLRTALGWAREQGEAETGLRLVAALREFWNARGHLREGRAWVEGLLELAAGDADGIKSATHAVSLVVRARALFTGGSLAMWQGDYAVAEHWLQEAEALGQAAGDRWMEARALNSLGTLAAHQGDLERAAARWADSLALMRAVGDQRGIAIALHNLGNVAAYQGDLERAAASFKEAVSLARQEGDQQGVALGLSNLGAVARMGGEVAQAEALLREALALLWNLGDRRACAGGLEELASTAGGAGQGERAAWLLGAAAALRETLDAPPPASWQAEVEQAVTAARAALGEEAWAAAFAAGRTLSLEQAIAEALSA